MFPRYSANVATPYPLSRVFSKATILWRPLLFPVRTPLCDPVMLNVAPQSRTSLSKRFHPRWIGLSRGASMRYDHRRDDILFSKTNSVKENWKLEKLSNFRVIEERSNSSWIIMKIWLHIADALTKIWKAEICLEIVWVWEIRGKF